MNYEQDINSQMLEENILGLAMTGGIDALSTGLTDDHFSNFYFKPAWNQILLMRRRKELPDLLSLSNALEGLDNTVNWFAILGDAAKNAMSPATAEGHIKKIKHNHRDRVMRKIGSDLASDPNPDLDNYIKNLMSLNQTDKKYLHSYSEAADDAFAEIERVMLGESNSIPTGLSEVDNLTGGLHNSDLIIVAARSAMGKTAFLLNMASANESSPLIFSTEQSRVQAMWRMFSSVGSVPNHKIRTGDLNDNDVGMMGHAMEKILKANGHIYDKSGPYMSEIEATAREVYQKHGCTAIYLDYLQRIKHENSNLPKHEQVGDIAMRLKELARELDIPVVALAQVNRRVETQQDKRPGMGDIKDSGTIEQEADQIMTIYRDEVYYDDSPDRGTAEVNFLKNRHGGNGMIRVKWNAPIMRFEDLNVSSNF